MLKICLYFSYDNSKSLEKITKQEKKMKALGGTKGFRETMTVKRKTYRYYQTDVKALTKSTKQHRLLERKQTKNRDNKKLFLEMGILKTATTEETLALLMEVKATELPTTQSKTAKVL